MYNTLIRMRRAGKLADYQVDIKSIPVPNV